MIQLLATQETGIAIPAYGVVRHAPRALMSGVHSRSGLDAHRGLLRKGEWAFMVP